MEMIPSAEAASPYTTKLTEPAELEDTFIRLYSSNLFLQVDPRAQFRWFYLNGPTGPGKTFFLQHRGQSEGGPGGVKEELVGCAGIGLRHLFHFGAPLPAALMGDFAVEPAHRKGVPALTLQKACRSYVNRHFTLTYGFPNDRAAAVFRRMGCTEVGQMRRYVRVLRHQPFVARHLPSQLNVPLLTWASGMAIDHAMLLGYRLREPRSVEGRPRFEWLPAPDERFDELWQATYRSYPLLGDRRARFLTWRFFEKPGGKPEIAALTDRRSRRLLAYAVIHHDRTQGGIAHIRDLFGLEDAHLSQLLQRMAAPLRRRGAATISMRFLGNRRIVRLLLAAGFAERPEGRTVILEDGSAAAKELPSFRDADRWYLTDADEDT